MAQKLKEKRNKEIVRRHEKGWSFRQLSEHYNIGIRAVWDIYQRDKGKYGAKQEEKKGVEECA